MSTSPLNHLSRLTQFVTALALAAGLLAPVTTPAADNVGATEAPLIIGHRNIHVFRGNLGDLTPSERADAARHHIERVLNEAGEGWTSIKLVDQGVLVLIDEKLMFTVTDSDVRKLTGETAEILANRASRVL